MRNMFVTRRPIFIAVTAAICKPLGWHSGRPSAVTHSKRKRAMWIREVGQQCLTFTLAVWSKWWTKTSSPWLEEVKPEAAFRSGGRCPTIPVCGFLISLLFARLKVSEEQRRCVCFFFFFFAVYSNFFGGQRGCLGEASFSGCRWGQQLIATKRETKLGF